jgi:hypothetical protein
MNRSGKICQISVLQDSANPVDNYHELAFRVVPTCWVELDDRASAQTV